MHDFVEPISKLLTPATCPISSKAGVQSIPEVIATLSRALRSRKQSTTSLSNIPVGLLLYFVDVSNKVAISPDILVIDVDQWTGQSV